MYAVICGCQAVPGHNPCQTTAHLEPYQRLNARMTCGYPSSLRRDKMMTDVLHARKATRESQNPPSHIDPYRRRERYFGLLHCPQSSPGLKDVLRRRHFCEWLGGNSSPVRPVLNPSYTTPFGISQRSSASLRATTDSLRSARVSCDTENATASSLHAPPWRRTHPRSTASSHAP